MIANHFLTWDLKLNDNLSLNVPYEFMTLQTIFVVILKMFNGESMIVKHRKCDSNL